MSPQLPRKNNRVLMICLDIQHSLGSNDRCVRCHTHCAETYPSDSKLFTFEWILCVVVPHGRHVLYGSDIL